MPTASTTSQKSSFFEQTPAELESLLSGWNWPAFRATQVLEWVYGRLIDDPARMSNLSALQREQLRERMIFSDAAVRSRQDSSDGTRKLLLAWGEQSTAETVMIPDGDRRTACVSSQVGCPVGCKFCASGINGVKGNLSAGQIVEQIFLLNRLLESDEAGPGMEPAAGTGGKKKMGGAPGRRISNVVFMGMGEPMANYANVMKAIRILHDPRGFNLGARRITISTVGVPARMKELAHEELPLNLAISLHAPNEPLRKELIPWAEHFALGDILEAARYYFSRTGREVTLEYILLAGVNDRPSEARELATLCRSLRVNVNLIRYNQVQGLPFGRPRSEDVLTFQRILRDAGVNAHVRKSRGRDIDAACGQLRRKEGELVRLGVAGSGIDEKG